MKFAKFLAILIVLVFSNLSSAQNPSQPENRWTQIENEEFAVSVPPDFVVNAEKGNSNQRYYIVGFQNGVRMNLTVYEEPDPKGRLKTTDFRNEAKPSRFEAENFSGVKLESSGENFFNTILLASNKKYYSVHVTAKDGGKPEIKRFLSSIRLNGKPLNNQTEPVAAPETTVKFDSLQTSPEVLAALNRKTNKGKSKVHREENASNKAVIDDNDKYSRPAIILFKAPLNRSSVSAKESSGQIRLRVQLLANGQIGDITVYSAADEDWIKAAIDAARQTKFVPAQTDGKPVDSFTTLAYEYKVSVGR